MDSVPAKAFSWPCKHHGLWCLASAPEDKVAGVLEGDERGELRLSLTGFLGDTQDCGFGLPEGQHRILGDLEDMRGATLEGCIALRSAGGFFQRRQEWHVSEAILGAHFDASEPWEFFGARFVVPLLTRWVSRVATQPIIDLNEAGKPRRIGAAVSVESWPLWSVADSTVDLIRCASTRETSETQTVVESRVDVRIRSGAAKGRDALHKHCVWPLQVLLGLSTGEFTAATEGGAYIESVGQRELPWLWEPHRIECNPMKFDGGFAFGDIAALPKGRLQQWIDQLASVEPIVNLYLASLRQLGYAELSFQLIVQALETYHRRLSADEIIAQDLWLPMRQRLHAVIDQLPTDLEGRQQKHSALTARLGYFNELGLRRRLKLLFELIGNRRRTVCGDDVAGFVDRVVNTRNYYTHWSTGLESKALRGECLLYATSRLLATLELLLLKDVGFELESAAADKIVHRRISWLRSS